MTREEVRAEANRLRAIADAAEGAANRAEDIAREIERGPRAPVPAFCDGCEGCPACVLGYVP